MNCKPAWLAGGLLLLFAAGCVTDASRARKIDSLHLFTAPVALDLAPPPGPDSIGLTLYASATATPRGVPIAGGRLVIEMFDGPLQPGGSNAAPRCAWTFLPPELKPLGVKTSLGHGYRFTLRWNNSPPREDRVTLVARYLTARDTAIESTPTTIAVTAK
jgi:hypothetical protein